MSEFRQKQFNSKEIFPNELSAWEAHDKKTSKKFENQYKEELVNKRTECISYDDKTNELIVDEDRYSEEYDKLYNEFISDNIVELTDDLNKELKGHDVSNVEVYYCGKY